MQKLIDGQSTKIELVQGQALYLNGHGIVTSSDDLPALGYQVYGWELTVGPFNYTRYLSLDALGVLEYEIRQEQGVTVRLVQIADADLPAVGDPGVIYETEAGWKRFENIDGTYKVIGDATEVPLAPDNTTAPVIAGEAEVDAVLTVTSNGEWDYRPTSFAYEWEIDGAEVEGATGQTFVVPVEAEGLDVTCVVTAFNAAGDNSESSNAISIPGE